MTIKSKPQKAELIKISEFQRRVFGDQGTPPCSQTIRRQIVSGMIPGKLIVGLWFIAWVAYQSQTGDSLVDNVLNFRKAG